MKKPYRISLLLMAAALAVSIGLFYRQNERMGMAKDDLAFVLIASRMVQLEGAIGYQVQEGWTTPSHATEKIEDVSAGLGTVMKIADTLGNLTESERDVLLHSLEYISQFREYSVYPGPVDEYKLKALEELRNRLRQAGWGMGIGYSGSWTIVLQQLKELKS